MTQYAGSIVHVLDASRVVGVMSDLLDDKRKVDLDTENRERQEEPPTKEPRA